MLDAPKWLYFGSIWIELDSREHISGTTHHLVNS